MHIFLHGWRQRLLPHHILIALLLCRLLAAAWFAYHSPLWSSFDEINHYTYARFIAHEGRLPQNNDYPDLPDDLRAYVQYNQQPLYYLMMSPLIVWLDPSPDTPLPPPNPAPICLNSSAMPFLQAAPDSAINQAAWAIRFATIGLGLLSLVFTWLAARHLWPQHPARAHIATLLLAIWPPAIDLTVWINSDAPLMAWGAFFIWAAARCWGKTPRWQDGLLLALALALCLGTKSTGAVVLLPVAALLWWRMGLLQGWSPRWGRRGPRLLLAAGLLLALLLIFPALNLLLCGQPLCRIHRETPMFDSWERFVYFLQRPDYEANLAYLARSATIPWLHEDQTAPASLYWLSGAGLLLGLALLPFAARQQASQRRILLWLLLWPAGALGLALLRVWWFPYTIFMPVRYLALALPALMLLLSVVYDRWRLALLLPLSIWAVLLLLIPPLFYAPLYPVPLRLDDLPAQAITVEPYEFSSGYRLGAYERIQDTSGYDVLRLYLQQSGPDPSPDLRYAWLSVYDAQGIALENCGLVLGGHSWPNIYWQPNEWLAQDFYFAALDLATKFDLQLLAVDTPAYLISNVVPTAPDERLSGAFIPLITGEE